MLEKPTRNLTRRTFLGHLTLGGMALSLMAACGQAAAPTATKAPVPTKGPTKPPAATAPPTKAPEATKPPAQVKTGGTLSIGYSQKTSVDHFMYLRDMAGGTSIYARLFANARLITRNADLTEWIPDLAEKWVSSEEGRRLTFHLRKGLKWQDGQPFTARDVDFTWHLMSMPGLGPINMGTQRSEFVVGMKEFVDGKADKIEGVKLIDDYTISFDLLKSYDEEVPLMHFSYVCIAPQHILQGYLNREKAKDILQGEWATTAKHVGIGPFKVVEYVPDQHIIYEPFAGYWRGRPNIDKLIYRPFMDAMTLNAALEKKEIDVGRLGATEYERFKKMDHLNFLEAKPPSYLGIHINTKRPYLADKRVRQALLMAIDRKVFSQALTAGTGDIIHTPIFMPKYGDSPTMKKYAYDPEKAKQLLKEAGWDPNQKIRWTVGAVPADETWQATVNGFWAKVGVQAEYQVVSADRENYMESKGWNYDLVTNALAMGHPAAISYYYDARGCTYACFHFTNARYEELYDKSVLAMPDEEKKKIIWELQDIIAENVPAFWMCRAADIWGMNKKVHNLRPLYMAHIHAWWDLEKVYVD